MNNNNNTYFDELPKDMLGEIFKHFNIVYIVQSSDEWELLGRYGTFSNKNDALEVAKTVAEYSSRHEKEYTVSFDEETLSYSFPYGRVFVIEERVYHEATGFDYYNEIKKDVEKRKSE